MLSQSELDAKLIEAAANDSTQVETLLVAKANIEAKDCFESPTLSVAAERGHDSTVKILLAAKANIEAENIFKCTPLLLAADDGHSSTVQILLAARANIEAKDCDGNTPLALAAKYSHDSTTKILLNATASPFVKNNKGETPLQLATLPSIQESLKAIRHRQRSIALCTGTHPRCGRRSVISQAAALPIFDRQLLRLFFALSGDGQPLPTKKSGNNKKRQRSPSLQ